ncbi:MAG: hypothetical protein JSW11_16210 [Candidatus Heimdallarchaeota archaeon]|nr:MAG: hypothetical protein JSW11_16210 [Candidatus Heimdallarchaeota archaeon]
MQHQVIFFHSLICPRCIRVRKIMRKIENNYPNVKIKRVGSVTKFLKGELRTLPAVKINNFMLYGKEITEERILDKIGLGESPNHH